MRIPPVIKKMYSEVKVKLREKEIKNDRVLLDKQRQISALYEDTFGFPNHT